MGVGGIEEGVTGWGKGGNSFFQERTTVPQPEVNWICSCWGRGEVPGGKPEKQTPLRSHQAGGKRQAVGSRIELCIKSSGFSRSLLSQCSFQPPQEEAVQWARQQDLCKLAGTPTVTVGTIRVLPLASYKGLCFLLRFSLSVGPECLLCIQYSSNSIVW